MTASAVGPLIAGAGLVLGLLIQGVSFAFLLGRHAERLSAIERDCVDLKVKVEEHAGAIAVLTAMRQLLEEVRHDVKNLLTGRVRPAAGSRVREEDLR